MCDCATVIEVAKKDVLSRRRADIEPQLDEVVIVSRFINRNEKKVVA